MHTFTDPDSDVRIYHNGDYSGTARMLIPLAVEEGWRVPADVDFDVPDADYERSAKKHSWMTPETYGMSFQVIQGRPFVEIRLPAKLLARFGGQAVVSGLVSKFEDMGIEGFLG